MTCWSANGSNSSDWPALDVLPAEPYRYAEWKKCLVAPDYHVEIDKHYYSVPSRLIRQTVEGRTLTPIFPPAAFKASAAPFMRWGKKKDMLAMLEAKLPPPSPAVAATVRKGKRQVKESLHAEG